MFPILIFIVGFHSSRLIIFLNHLQVFKECHLLDNSGNSFELALIGCKCIGAYVKNKKNQNQVMYF